MITSVREGILKVKGLWKEGEEEEPSFFEEKNQVRLKGIQAVYGLLPLLATMY